MSTPLAFALWLAESHGLKVHPNYGIVDVLVEDEHGQVRTSRDCACPPEHDARNVDGVCTSAGKHPIIAFTDPVHGSSSDPAVIRAWWEQWPEANLGVRTDGIAVVDVDYRNGGLDTHVWLEQQPGSPLTPTLTIKTGNGFHQYYRGQTTKAGGKLGKGIDFKSGPSAQVVGPGSEHLNGAHYEVMLDHAIVPPAHPLEPVTADVHKPQQTYAGLPAGDGVTRKAGPGERNDFLVTKGAILRNYFDDKAAFIAVMQLIGARECEPAADTNRVNEIALNLWNREGGADWRELLAAVDMRGVPSGDGSAAEVALRAVDPDQLAALLNRVKGIADVLMQPPPRWLIQGIMPEADLAVLFGDGGTKKSFVALDWMLSAAFQTARDGEPTTHWHGRTVQPMRGLYIAAEGMAGMNRRLRAWSYARGVPLEQLAWTPTPGAAAFGILPGVVNLRSSAAVDGAIAVVDALQLNYVVVDTYRRATPGADENSAKDMGEALAGAERIAKRGCRVLLVHHSPATAKDRHRGHSSIKDDVDVVLGLRKVGKLASVLFPVKLKDAAEFDELRITFGTYPTGLTDEEGEEVTSLVSYSAVPENDEDTAVERAVASLGPSVDVMQRYRDLAAPLAGAGYSKADLCQQLGYDTPDNRAFKSLLKQGKAEGWLVYSAGTKTWNVRPPAEHVLTLEPEPEEDDD